MNNLNTMNVQELSTQEMKKTDGGLLFCLAIVGLLLLSSCAVRKPLHGVGGGAYDPDDLGNDTTGG